MNSVDNQSKRECVAYFKSRKGFDRLFKGFRSKYVGLGHIGGSVKLDNLSVEEKESFEGFFRKNFHRQKSAVISAKKMEQSLEDSRFSGIGLYELLVAYFGGSLETKEEERDRIEQEKKTFWLLILEKYENTFCGNWLSEVMETKGKVYQFLNQRYKECGNQFHVVLDSVMTAGNALPVFNGTVERLALFSARLTGNPHFFDEGSEGNRILTYLVQYYAYLEESKCKNEEAKSNIIHREIEKYSAEKKNELFYTVGILKEDILNYTNAYGIKLRKGNGEFHLGVEGFYQENQPIQISLLTLSKITAVWSVAKKVYIVENSGVFSELSERVSKDVALVCTNGQPHLASLILLDLFFNANYELFYSGDFDPEGLQIAQKLKDRYGYRLHLWRYSEESYKVTMSEVELTGDRIKKMESLKEPHLKIIAELISKTKRAGYQERLVEAYLDDMERNYHN